MILALRHCCGTYLLLAAALCASIPGLAAEPRPLVAMWQLEPTEFPLDDFPSMAAPRAILYEDGSAIGLVLPGRTEREVYLRALAQPLFATSQLSAIALGAWYEDIFAVARMEDLSAELMLDPQNPEPVVWLCFFAGERAITVAIRGLNETALDRFGTPRMADAGPVPARLLRIYQDLSRLADARAVEWHPHRIELQLHPAPPSRSPTLSWPGWTTRVTQSRSDDRDSVSLLVDGSAHDRLVALLPAPLSQHAVRFEERTMTVRYRFMFPGEAAWRGLWEKTLPSLSARENNPARDPQAAQREHESLREAIRSTPSLIAPAQR